MRKMYYVIVVRRFIGFLQVRSIRWVKTTQYVIGSDKTPLFLLMKVKIDFTKVVLKISFYCISVFIIATLEEHPLDTYIHPLKSNCYNNCSTIYLLPIYYG